MVKCVQNSFGSEQGTVIGSCEHSTIQENVGNFLSRQATVNFSGITLLFGLNWHTTYIWHLDERSHCEFWELHIYLIYNCFDLFEGLVAVCCCCLYLPAQYPGTCRWLIEAGLCTAVAVCVYCYHSAIGNVDIPFTYPHSRLQTFISYLWTASFTEFTRSIMAHVCTKCEDCLKWVLLPCVTA
jgi:hypothetical protein